METEKQGTRDKAQGTRDKEQEIQVAAPLRSLRETVFPSRLCVKPCETVNPEFIVHLINGLRFIAAQPRARYMKQIKELTVFTDGDSSRISTWSNFPYFFTETLIKKGIRVNRVNLGANSFLGKFHNRFLLRLHKLINRKTTFTYTRSALHYADARRRIRNAEKKYPDADANIFLTFSFTSADISDKPVLQFCDWTYDYYFKYFKKREPDAFEKLCIRREDRQIEQSDLVVAFFPAVAAYMHERYNNKNIFYLGSVVNTLYSAEASNILPLKRASTEILFVGNSKYLEGAICLLDTFREFRKEHPAYSLHIIGMDRGLFVKIPDGVYCHGYLDKGKVVDRELYYSLFRRAKLFINTTPVWGAFSATMEAMYFFTPVIIASTPEMTMTLGGSIDCGEYCENEPGQLSQSMHRILNHPQYEIFCSKAHDAVKDNTWDAYMDKILEKLREEK